MLALEQDGTCELDRCTPDCAATFVPLFERCPSQMQALLNTISGVYRFLGNCYEVYDGVQSPIKDGAEDQEPYQPAIAQRMVLFSDAVYCLPASLLDGFDCPPCASLHVSIASDANANESRTQRRARICKCIVDRALYSATCIMQGFTPIATAADDREAVFALVGWDDLLHAVVVTFRGTVLPVQHPVNHTADNEPVRMEGIVFTSGSKHASAH